MNLPPALLPRIGKVTITGQELRFENGQVEGSSGGKYEEVGLAEVGQDVVDQLTATGEAFALYKRSASAESYAQLYRRYDVEFGFPLPDGPVLLVDAFQLLHAHLLMGEALPAGRASAFIYRTSDQPGMSAVRLDPDERDWMVGFGFGPIPTVCARYTPEELHEHLALVIRATRAALEDAGAPVDVLLRALPPRAEFCSLALRENFFLSTPPRPPLHEW